MTADHSASSHSTYLTDHQESPHMNLDTIAQLETQARQAEIRHHLDERVLERAASGLKHTAARSGPGGPGILSGFIGRLAPQRVATAGGGTSRHGAPQPGAAEGIDSCSPVLECANGSAHRPA
jgi:hypothetical protein